MVARARKAVFPPAPEVVSGVQFPKTSERGDRSTTVTGKAAWRGLAAELGAAALRTLRCAMPRSRDGRAFGRMHIRNPQPMKNRRMTPPTTMPAVAKPAPAREGSVDSILRSDQAPRTVNFLNVEYA